MEVEHNIINLLKNNNNNNVEDIYNIYKLLKNNNLIDDRKVIRLESDRDIVFYLLENMKKDTKIYQEFFVDYIQNKTSDVFKVNKYGYYPLEFFLDNIEYIEENVCISIFEEIMSKFKDPKEIMSENYFKSYNQLTTKLINIGYLEFLDYLKNKELFSMNDFPLYFLFSNEKQLKYFINNKDLNEIVTFQEEKKFLWQILLDKASMSLTHIIEDWCNNNLSKELLNYKNIEIINKTKSNLNYQACLKLKNIENWESLYDENNISLSRFVINQDPTHANKITLKKSLESLSSKDYLGENVWKEVFLHLHSMHKDSVSFIVNFVPPFINNDNETVFENFTKNSINKYFVEHIVNSNYDNNIKSITKLDPNIIIGDINNISKYYDFDDLEIFDSKNFNSNYRNNYKNPLFFLQTYFKMLKSDKISKIENKEWLGLAILLIELDKNLDKEKKEVKLQEYIEKGAIIPRIIEKSIVENLLINNDEILKKLRINQSYKEKEILSNNLNSNNNPLKIKRI